MAINVSADSLARSISDLPPNKPSEKTENGISRATLDQGALRGDNPLTKLTDNINNPVRIEADRVTLSEKAGAARSDLVYDQEQLRSTRETTASSADSGNTGRTSRSDADITDIGTGKENELTVELPNSTGLSQQNLSQNPDFIARNIQVRTSATDKDLSGDATLETNATRNDHSNAAQDLRLLTDELATEQAQARQGLDVLA